MGNYAKSFFRTVLMMSLSQTCLADVEVQTTRFDPIIVTASRFDEHIASVAANITVINREDIENSTATDIPTILQQEAGLHSYDITGNARSYRVDRSGFGATAALNTLVLVDGMRLNNPDLAGVDWMLIHLNRVERIEIIRGSRGSVLYGDNATDNVINIITKTNSHDSEAVVEGSGGSYNTRDLSVYLSGAYDATSYAFSAGDYQSDGYRDNSDTEQQDLGLNVDHYVGDVARISFKGVYHKDTTGLPGGIRLSELDLLADRRDSLHPSDFVDTQDYYTQMIPEIQLSRNSVFKLPLAFRNREQSFVASFMGGGFQGNTMIAFKTASPQLVVKEPLGILDNNLTLGIDYHSADENIYNESTIFGSVDKGRFRLQKKNIGVYVYDELSPLEKLSLTAGYRWDKVDYRFTPTVSGTANDISYDLNIFNTGMSYRFLPNSHVYFSYAQGFRYPAFDELFSFYTNRLNEAMKPQQSDDFELGLRQYLTDSVYAGINLFRLDTVDEIYFNPVSYTNENFDGKIRRQGIETSIKFHTESFSIGGTYTYKDDTILDGIFSGNEVPNVPTHSASIDLEIRPTTNVILTFNGIYVGSRLYESDFANEFDKLDGYEVLNIKLALNGPEYNVFMDLKNVLNEEYSAYGVLSTYPVEPAIYPSPEFNLSVGVRIDL